MRQRREGWIEENPGLALLFQKPEELWWWFFGEFAIFIETFYGFIFIKKKFLIIIIFVCLNPFLFLFADGDFPGGVSGSRHVVSDHRVIKVFFVFHL